MRKKIGSMHYIFLIKNNHSLFLKFIIIFNILIFNHKKWLKNIDIKFEMCYDRFILSEIEEDI